MFLISLTLIQWLLSSTASRDGGLCFLRFLLPISPRLHLSVAGNAVVGDISKDKVENHLI